MSLLLFLAQKFFAFGCLGMLIEIFFTGFGSLITKHWKLTGRTYLPMFFVYGFAALMLEAISQALPWPFYLKAFIYVPLIYGMEALSGWGLSLLTGLLQKKFGGTEGGEIPWKYPKSAWSPLGLINLTYAPFWLLLAMAFDPISSFLHKVLLLLVKVE